MQQIALPLLAASVAVLLAVAAPAQAQTYTPGFPVCLRVYGPINYYDCSYASLAQCNATASGRPAQCVLNPYFASAGYDERASRRPRRREAY